MNTSWKTMLMAALGTVCVAFAADAQENSSERMNVSVCNLGELPGTVVARAENEASAVFRSMNVEVVWRECSDGPAPPQAARAHWFTLHLRSDAPPRMAGLASLDTMGLAYFAADGTGFLADTYYKAVQWVAGSNTSDAADLLGCVMAHELGHLLLGPGHVPNGIMHAAWKSRDVEAARKHWLTFNTAQSARIRSVLETTAGAEVKGGR